VVLVLFGVKKYLLAPSGEAPVPATGDAHRVLVLANETVNSEELLDELRRIDAEGAATYFVSVPASPIETGQAAAQGPLKTWEATTEAAQRRLDHTLTTLRSEDLSVQGELGDFRPLRALDNAVEAFRPDRIVIATHPLEESIWQRYEVVDRARSNYQIPVVHVVARSTVPTQLEEA
jgi:GABA permease